MSYAILSVQIVFLLFRSYNCCSGNMIRNRLGFQSSCRYPSFSSFYAKTLLNEVSDFTGKEKSEYRILNIGILPAVTRYNGYYTLDSYQNNYPLEYKLFPGEVHPVEIISGEYAKNRILYDLELNADALRIITRLPVYSPRRAILSPKTQP